MSRLDLGYDKNRDKFEAWFSKNNPHLFDQDRLRDMRSATGGYWEPNPDGDKPTPINSAWWAWNESAKAINEEEQ